MKKGVIYARFSSHNQKDESIEQQVEECSDFARANDIAIVDIYSDEAISGKTDKRKAFQRMMKDAEKNKFEVVIAYKSNRIARNMLNALSYESKLEKLGISTLYAKEEFGNTASGRFALRTMMNVNQFYSENLAEDVKRGMRDNAEKCKVNGSIPYGYRKSSDGRFEIHPEKAEVIREIFDKVLHGRQFVDIAADLNARGLKTRQGNDWNKSSFVRILRNESYIGIYKHSGVVVDGGMPPIVDRATFQAVQDLLNSKTPYGRNRDYLLTGKLTCGQCGSQMVGISGTSQNGSRHFYYVCQGHRITRACDKHSEIKDDLEYKVARLTRDIVLQDEMIEWLADAAIAFQKKASAASGLKNFENQKREKEKAIKNILTAIEQGIFTASTKERLLELEAEVSKLTDTIAVLKESTKPIERDRIIFALQQFRDEDVLSKRYQKVLIDSFIKEVKVWDDKIQIDYFYTGADGMITVPTSSAVDSGSAYCVDFAPPNAHSTNFSSCAFSIVITASYFSLVTSR